MLFVIRPALFFLLFSFLILGGCTIAPKFTPTSESSKTFTIMYQDSVSKQPEHVVKGQNETLKNLEK